MSTVQEFVHGLRKAELQTIHQFWLPGESVQSTRDELKDRLTDTLRRGDGIEERVARLTRVQRELIIALLQLPGHTLETRQLVGRLETRGIPRIEAESSSRMLVERGFVERRRPPSRGRMPGREVFTVPDELASHLKRVLEIEGMPASPGDQLSQKRLEFEIDFEGSPDLDERIDALDDPDLAALARIAVAQRGLADEDSPGVAPILEGGPLARPEWRSALEDAGIGTIGTVALQDFGIVVRAPSVVIFQEWIQRRARARLAVAEVPDLELEAGVDLYIDIERVANRIEAEPPRLTRSGRVPKRLAESLRGELALTRLADHLDGDPVQRALWMGLRLGIIENFAEQLRVHDERLRSWRKLDVVRQADLLLKKFLDESQGERWSFHQESLRRILCDRLLPEVSDGWVSLDALVTLAVSTYVLELEEREVHVALRQRRNDDFSREKLQSTFQRLGTDLLYWIVNRMLLLGLCELGLVDGRLTTFRLTSLAKDRFGIAREPRECRILVNPDFEIVLFSEGLRGMRLELQLARFGTRLSAERVRRYRVDRDSMRRGIHSGLSGEEILGILEASSSHPIPETVRVAVRDWGRDLDWVIAEPAIVLGGLRPERAAEIAGILEAEGIAHQRATNGGIVITGPSARGDGGEAPRALALLRERGWLVREERGDALELRSEKRP